MTVTTTDPVGIRERLPGTQNPSNGPRAVLRPTDLDGVYQEFYAYLITYQAIRALAAAAIEDIDPDRLSFPTALDAVGSTTVDYHITLIADPLTYGNA